MEKRKLISITLIIAVFLAITLTYYGANRGTAEEVDSNGFIRQFDKDIETLKSQYGVQGVAVALIEEGKVAWKKEYGYADVEKKIPVTEDTVFRAASISKPVGAWGVMKLVEEGKIQLDDPVEKYLTRWHIPDSPFDKSKVTIRQLLSHTSGLNEGGAPGYDPAKPLPTIEESLSGIAGEHWRVKLEREPGTSFFYSNGGCSVLQLLIEEVTGKSYQTYMQETLFIPLGLRGSRYNPNYPGNDVIATPYNGYGQPFRDKPVVENAAGGLYTTLRDLAQFTAACTQGGEDQPLGRGVLKPETLKLMFSPQPHTESIYGVYGLGFIPESFANGIQIVSHSGNITGWNSEIAFIPEQGKGFVVLTNSDAGFYFHKELLGLWSKRVAGVTLDDTIIVEKMKQILWGVIVLLAALLIFLVARTIRSLKRGRRQFKIAVGQRAKILQLSRGLMVFFMVAVWYLMFYSEVFIQWAYGMDNYYLFTFFTPNFKWITLLVTLLGGYLAALAFLPKEKKMKNNSWVV